MMIDSRKILDDRWLIHRIGLVNFWYYDEEEFRFYDGRLLLRGSNGSGKSVTMQSFIPLLLDGNKSPERLDPFGSRARKLENYLLGEDDLGEDERTGYLYMEFIKKDAGVYLSIGMGLRAKRGKSMDFWGFSITDGRRIGKDFFLYKEIGEKVPLSKIELKNRIGSGGEFYESQSEYMKMVNKLLFGFENIEDYDELIKLLVHLRTPKLSKDFKPTVIYDIMNNSLQPLSDDDLRPMSEAIENMDNIKSQLEVLKENKKAADRLKTEYDKYNRFVLYEKAKNLINAKEQLTKANKELALLEKEGDEYKQNYEQAEKETEQLRVARKGYEHKERELKQHDSYRAKQELLVKEQQLEQLAAQEKEKQNSLDAKKKRQIQLESESKNLQDQQERIQQEMRTLMEEMESVAEDFYFDEHVFAQAEIQKNMGQLYQYSFLEAELKRYRERIAKGKKVLEMERQQSQEYDRVLSQLDQSKKEKEEALRELEKANTLLDEAREEFVEKLYRWHKQNHLLHLSDTALIETVRLARSYGQSAGYDDLVGVIRKEFNGLESSVREKIAGIKAQRNGYVQEQKNKERELLEWKNKKDPEPIREERVMRNREKLARQGIPFMPLYKSVDFQEHLTEEAKGCLEQALMDMGLLDALIIPEKYRQKVMRADTQQADKYIFPHPEYFRHELSMLLKPEQEISGEFTGQDIDDVLKSIMLDNEDSLVYINEKGEYGIGIVQGKTGGGCQPKFIGIQARKKYREEMMAAIEEEIKSIRSHIQEQDDKLNLLADELEKLGAEFANMPAKDDMETAFGITYRANLVAESKKKEVESGEQAVEKSYSLLKRIRDEVREAVSKMQIPLNVEAFEKAQQSAEQYKDLLSNLQNMHQYLLNLIKQAQMLAEQLEDILQDMEDIRYDLVRINRNQAECAAQIENYKEVLKRTNYEDIEKEIEECIKALETIPLEIEKKVEAGAVNREKYSASINKLGSMKQMMLDLEQTYEVYREAFRKEYKLEYVIHYQEDMDVDDIAKKAHGELRGQEKENKTKEDYVSSLQERYHETRQYLTEYSMILKYLFDEPIADLDERMQKLASLQKRVDITAKIQGKEVGFYALLTFLQDAIDENERLFKESDRQLFEDILAHTISKKIRARIYHAEQWVKKMNDLMESMNTSSGLNFSLMWKSRTAESEEQMDTKELVDILKSDANLLSEEDFGKLSAHFRSKIAQAKKELEDTGGFQTFHAIMKEILDYRKWFEFRLFFRKTGENKKELTNNAFDRFSGGEKAMAMYVPLFSSVYARYEGARKDCPRIISLDEAFAGVDENNIRDMFRLLEELNLNFVINSQILWGDYDTVPSLSICELVRPNNANFVTVIRYRWNGRVKELVTN